MNKLMRLNWQKIFKFDVKKLFYLYSFLLFGIMPLIVTPWQGEIYYNGKIAFTAIITFLFVLYLYNKDQDLLFNKFDRVTWFIIIYTALLFLATAFSIDRRISLFGQIHSREGLVVLLLYLVVFYLFYKQFSFSLKIYEGVLICSCIVSIIGMLQFLNILPNISSFANGPWESGLSTIGNRNFAGTFCTIFLPMAIGFVFYVSHMRGLVYSGIIFGFLLVSQTRSAWIAFFVYILLFLLINIKSKKIILKWLVLFAFIAGIFFGLNYLSDSAIENRFKMLIYDFLNIEKDSSGSDRVFYWKKTLPYMFEHPILGYGPDTFGVFYRQTYGFLKLYFEKIHNEYLQIAFTMGYPALILYLGMVGHVLYGLVKRLRFDPKAQVLFCIVVGYLIQAFFNVSMLTNAVIYWALLGVSLNIQGESVDNQKELNEKIDS